jgi:hypothetical protein
MTISSTARVAGPFVGAGTAATFPFTFKLFDASDLEVAKLNQATGVIAELSLDSDYTAALNADQDASPGGSITLIAGNLASGYTLTVTTSMAGLQGLDLKNGGGFYPDVINAALDRLTILVQQLQAQIGRALRLPLPDTAIEVELPGAALRAGNLLMFDSSGSLQLVPVAGGRIVPGAQTAIGTVDGSNPVFTFTAAAGATPSIIVFAGGVFQDPATDYMAPVFVSGTTWRITFTSAPTNGPIKVLMLG